MINLYNGDCLEVMDELIEQGIKVNCVLADIPYGTTACKWDIVIPFDAMWERLNKLIKKDSVIVLFGNQPFTSKLICSNVACFVEEIIWEKTIGVNFYQVKRRHSKKHENIIIFSNGRHTYNPQMDVGKPYKDKARSRSVGINSNIDTIKKSITNNGTRYPSSVKKISNGNNGNFHPTQKPVVLLEYLIKTYTNEKEVVLDFTMGSGSTGVACKNTGRSFIGIELDNTYFEIAKKRIEEA